MSQLSLKLWRALSPLVSLCSIRTLRGCRCLPSLFSPSQTPLADTLNEAELCDAWLHPRTSGTSPMGLALLTMSRLLEKRQLAINHHSHDNRTHICVCTHVEHHNGKTVNISTHTHTTLRTRAPLHHLLQRHIHDDAPLSFVVRLNVSMDCQIQRSRKLILGPNTGTWRCPPELSGCCSTCEIILAGFIEVR